MQPIPLSEVKKQIATLSVAEGFFESMVLFALCELGLFKALADGPQTADRLREMTGTDAEALAMLLEVAVALKLIWLRDGRYGADEATLDCLGREGSPAYIGEWIDLLRGLIEPLQGLPAIVRQGRRRALYDNMNDAATAALMTRAMDAYGRTRGIEIAFRMDFSDVGDLLDIGCGPGIYTLAIVQQFPNVKGWLLDLPGPIAVARELVAQRGLTDRVEFIAADAREYLPDRTFDAVLISNTLHHLGAEESRALLRRCRDIVRPGGRIYIQAQYLDEGRTSPRWPALLNLVQLTTTRAGRNHSVAETSAWLSEAGFEGIEYVRFSLWNVCSCVVARRPAA